MASPSRVGLHYSCPNSRSPESRRGDHHPSWKHRSHSSRRCSALGYRLTVALQAALYDPRHRESIRRELPPPHMAFAFGPAHARNGHAPPASQLYPPHCQPQPRQLHRRPYPRPYRGLTHGDHQPIRQWHYPK